MIKNKSIHVFNSDIIALFEILREQSTHTKIRELNIIENTITKHYPNIKKFTIYFSSEYISYDLKFVNYQSRFDIISFREIIRRKKLKNILK